MRHEEIMTQSERNTMSRYTSMILASALFLVCVQIPLSIKYFLLVRKDATLHGHLLRRVYMFPLFSFPMFYLGSTQAEKHLGNMSTKYLGDLNDYELDNFETLYRTRQAQLRQQ